jgi:hypothetical protein
MFTIMLDLQFKSLEVVENYVGHGELIHLTFELFIYLFIDSILNPKHLQQLLMHFGLKKKK